MVPVPAELTDHRHVGPGGPPHLAYKSDAAATSSMRRASRYHFPVWYLAVLAAVVAVVATGGQAAHADSGIVVVGGAQATSDRPGLGALMAVAAFETFDGHSYLLALNHDGIHTINVTDPLDPVRVGGIVHDWFVDSWLTGMKVFYSPDGRVYAAVAGDGFLILDVTDPTEPVIINGAPGGAGSSYLAFGDVWQATVYERPDGRVHALVDGNALRIVDITDPYNPVTLEEGPDISLRMAVDGNTAFLEPADGRIYVMYGGLRDGVFIADVTDPARHVLVSAIRHYDGDPPQGHEDPFRTYGIPAPSSSDVLIADRYAEGLDYVREIAVFDSPDGRTYAMVANAMATIRIDESDPYVVPAGIIFLDVTNPHVPAPVGAILDGEGGFDFGSRIRNLIVLESLDGHVHAAVAGDQDVVILDVTDPTGPVLVDRIRDGEGGFDYADGVRGMAVVRTQDGLAHLAMAGGEGIQMANMADPGALVPAGGIPSSSTFFGSPIVFESADDRAYVLGVGGDAITLADITDPRLPVPLGSVRDGKGGFDTLDGVWQVEVLRTPNGPIYAVAVGWEGLQIIEVTDTGLPVVAGTLANGTGGFETGWIISTAILRQPGESNSYLLVADHGRGIQVVDVTDPRAPVLAGGLSGGEGGIDLLGGIHDMDIFEAPDGRPYALMTGDRGIHTIDMTDPAAPVVVGTIDGAVNGTFGEHGLTAAYQSVIFGSIGGRVHALVADYMTGIHIIDLTDPHAPTHTGSVPTRVEGGVEVIPGSGVAVATSPDGRIWALVVGRDDIQVLEITDPRAPALVDSILAGEGGLGLEMTPWDIIMMEPASGRVHILASGGDYLWVLDVTYPLPPAVPHADVWGGILGPDIGRIAKTAESLRPGSAGVVVPGPDGDAVIVRSPDGSTYVMWVGLDDGLLAAEVAGLYGADDPSFWWTSPREADGLPTVLDSLAPVPGSVIELFRPHDGRTYMMIGGDDSILVVDVTYPHAPAPVAAIRDNLDGFYTLGGIGDISAFTSPDGRTIALVGSCDGIQVIDVTNPYAPISVGSIHEVPGMPAYEGIRWIAAVPIPDGRVVALAADGAGRAGMLDVTNPRLPVPTVAAPPAGNVGPILGMAVFEAPDDHVHILLAGEDGSRVIDVTNPTDPAVVAVFGGMAAPEGPQDGSAGEDGMARVAIRPGASDSNSECAYRDECYVPQTVTINVGDTVTWRNEDDTAHGLVGALDTDRCGVSDFGTIRLLPGAEFSHRFGEAGEYTYSGFPGPWLIGKVVVVE